MKKYYQAALALTAALSLIALLFYRHEYNKLRFVLQVFNYFGTPSKNGTNDICNLSPLTSNKFNSDFSEPISSWQRITNDLYVFSAYNIDGEVRAIAFGMTDSIKKNEYSCNIVTNLESPQKISGKFSFEIMSEDDKIDVAYVNGNKFYGLILSCKNSNNLKTKKITGVQFIENNQKNVNSIIKVGTIVENSKNNLSVLCVAPNNTPIKRMDMISFLAFHENIAIRNFIIYDSGISDVFNFAVKSLSQISNSNFTYSTVIWNFPFENIENRVVRHIIESDCLLRTFGKAKIALTLTWNEYINLKYHSSLLNVISDYNKVTGKSGDPFSIETFIFCTEGSSVNDSLNFSTPMILSTTKRLRGEGSQMTKNIYELGNKEKLFTKRNSKNKLDDLAIVYTYEECNGDQEVIDNQVLRFASVMPSSQIFQFYITGKLFSSD